VELSALAGESLNLPIPASIMSLSGFRAPSKGPTGQPARGHEDGSMHNRADRGATWRGVERAGAVALFAALVLAVVLAVGAGGWSLLLVVYRTAGVVLTTMAVPLMWRAGGRTVLPGARRHWRLMAAALAMTAVDAIIALVYSTAESLDRYPLTILPIQLADMAAVVLAVAAVLVIPAKVGWSRSRLRLGLDLATVMLSAAIFLWHFLIGGALEGHTDLRSAALTVVLVGGLLVGVFAVTRVVLTGAAGVRRGPLMAFAAAGLTTAVAEAVTPTLERTEHLHVALSLSVLFYACAIAAPLLQLRAPRVRQPDHIRRGRPFSIVPFAAVAATQALLVAVLLGDHPERARGVLAGVIALTGLVVARQIVALRDNSRLVLRLDESLASQRQAVARSQVLAETGTALMTALDAQRIYDLAAGAASKLLAGHSAERTLVIAPSATGNDDWRVTAVAGGGSPCASDIAVADLSELRARLTGGACVVGADLAADLGIPQAGPAGWSRWAVLLLLQDSDQHFGVLVADGGAAISADVLKSLDTLRTQVTLALELMAVTTELTRRAMHDPLTGLANRTLIHETIDRALARAQRTGDHVGVLLLDLNGFKQINDTMGHEAGDELLREVAHRLAGCVRIEDTLRLVDPEPGRDSKKPTTVATIGRLGGDEFVVVAERLADVESACAIAERITRTLIAPMPYGGRDVPVRASIGVALSGPQARDADELLRQADAAMYAEKRRVGIGSRRFDPAAEAAGDVPVLEIARR
jgi:GGDEF domain-containing protein